MQFIANLRKQTIDAFTELGFKPNGYLLSTHRATPSALRQAAIVRAQGVDLFADNGTKEHIEAVLEMFREPAKAINQQMSAIRRTLGKIPRGLAIPRSLRKQAAQLAKKVVAECTRRSESIDTEALVTAQLSMNPTHMIAQEDFATACLVGLGLERYITGWRIDKIRQRNRRSIRLYQRVAKDPRCQHTKVFAVLSAMDFNTARAAGRLAAKKGITHVAIGMVGIMRDARATNFFVLGRRNFTLPQATPRRYARFAELVLGLRVGYDDEKIKLESFHALGLGAAPMLPFLALAKQQVASVTLDASSPIHDAVKSRVMYEYSKAADRVSCIQAVQRIVEGGQWKFDTPFLKKFGQTFVHDPPSARNWWHDQGKPKITKAALKNSVEFQSSLPLFTRVDRDLTRSARHTHVAHNHFVISQLANQLRASPAVSQVATSTINQMLKHHSTIIKRGITAMQYIFSKARI